MASDSASTYPSADDIANKLRSSIIGKVVLITGPSLGSIGFEAAKVIAKHDPRLLILAGRSQNKLDEASAAILEVNPGANLRTLLIDVGDFDSVRKAAQIVSNYSERIDALINNAGFVALTYIPTSSTTEATFTGNHLGPFLFTNLIRNRLSTEARIVNIASAAHHRSPVRFEDLNYGDGKAFDNWNAYGQSKTANILFATSIGKKWPGIEAFSVHPGLVESKGVKEGPLEEFVAIGIKAADGTFTDVAKGALRTLGQGASGYIAAAFDPALKGHSGAYLVEAQEANEQAAPYAKDPELAETLWKLSEELVGLAK